jgi:hypothetical protein
MLLSLSGEKSSQEYNLNAITGGEMSGVGIADETILLKIAEAVFSGDKDELSDVREEGLKVLGAQGLVDAITVAAGFNGITKVANATGLPLDEATESSTVEMRQETKIDEFADSFKADVFR